MVDKASVPLHCCKVTSDYRQHGIQIGGLWVSRNQNDHGSSCAYVNVSILSSLVLAAGTHIGSLAILMQLTTWSHKHVLQDAFYKGSHMMMFCQMNFYKGAHLP